MKYLDKIKLILFMIVQEMGQAITHARKGSTIIFVTVFGKMVNVDWGFPFLLIPF